MGSATQFALFFDITHTHTHTLMNCTQKISHAYTNVVVVLMHVVNSLVALIPLVVIMLIYMYIHYTAVEAGFIQLWIFLIRYAGFHPMLWLIVLV